MILDISLWRSHPDNSHHELLQLVGCSLIRPEKGLKPPSLVGAGNPQPLYPAKKPLQTLAVPFSSPPVIES